MLLLLLLLLCGGGYFLVFSSSEHYLHTLKGSLVSCLLPSLGCGCDCVLAVIGCLEMRRNGLRGVC